MRTLLALLLSTLALTAQAQSAPPPQPLWEIGLVGSGATVPDYPGSDRTRGRALVLPYGIYRGRTVRADGGGLRGRYRFTPDTELDLSFGGALPADSSGNPAREGMPDLDLLLEIGPRLTLTFARPAPDAAVSLVLPLRAVFSTDFSGIESQGFIATPELVYSQRRWLQSPWRMRVAVGPVYATEPLMDYFYGVAPTFARAGRPAYEARAGYLESRFTLAVSRELTERFTLFLFARANSLHGAANEDSPLLQQRSNAYGGFGLAWTFRRSDETVAAEIEP